MEFGVAQPLWWTVTQSFVMTEQVEVILHGSLTFRLRATRSNEVNVAKHCKLTWSNYSAVVRWITKHPLNVKNSICSLRSGQITGFMYLIDQKFHSAFFKGFMCWIGQKLHSAFFPQHVTNFWICPIFCVISFSCLVCAHLCIGICVCC